MAVALAGGLSLEAASTAVGVTTATARNHLKHIFAKTETHRQAQLVALLAHTAGLREPDD